MFSIHKLSTSQFLTIAICYLADLALLQAQVTDGDIHFPPVERWKARNTVCRHMCGAAGCVNWTVTGLDRDRCLCHACGPFYNHSAKYCVENTATPCTGASPNVTEEMEKPEALRFTHSGCELRVSGTTNIHVYPTCYAENRTVECNVMAVY